MHVGQKKDGIKTTRERKRKEQNNNALYISSLRREKTRKRFRERKRG